LRENTIERKDERLDKLEQQGKTVVFLLEEKRPIGAIALADIIRKESREAVDKLKSMNIKCMMLTGDNRFVARWVAEELGLDDFFFLKYCPMKKHKPLRMFRKIISLPWLETESMMLRPLCRLMWESPSELAQM
jgi:Cu2+-exporting ATPase